MILESLPTGGEKLLEVNSVTEEGVGYICFGS